MIEAKEGVPIITNPISIVSVNEANQTSSRVTQDEEHRLNNTPSIDMSDDEKIDLAAARILEKYKPAFLELAK